MSVSVVARRYAQALLELGLEQGNVERIADELDTVAGAWRVSADLRNVIENPLVPHEAKRAVVTELTEQIGASATTRNALLLLVDRRRTKTLPYIARTLRELADARRGVLRAEVTTAVALGDGYYARLQAQLERMTGKRVVVDRTVDPAILGGVVTRLGDRIIDGSLRTRLESLRDAIAPTL
ncbi:MAG: ATP synthase F1 subunit delta [Myxococcales bacterium]|nr:ATP synthase F1 subunit delta [Myxococcales bacterium]